MLRPLLATVGFLASACGLDPEGVPEGKLAVVGPTVFGPEDLAAVQAQLGAYAQLRFRGAEGRVALLGALIDAEVLAQAARKAGLEEDPRVRWALLEELAALTRSAELERRVPYRKVAEDIAALRAYFDAHPQQFTRPERRGAQGVMFSQWGEADEALAKLRAGAVRLEDLGDVVRTPLQLRDDHEYPGFHPVLFAAGEVGQWLAEPVVVGEKLLVGRLAELEPARRSSFDDPAVRERLIEEVRAPRLAEARAALLAELEQQFPETSPASP